MIGANTLRVYRATLSLTLSLKGEGIRGRLNFNYPLAPLGRGALEWHNVREKGEKQ